VDVAVQAGISRSHLAKLETGGDGPGLASLSALADIYGVSLDYLKGGPPLTSLDLPEEKAKDLSEVTLLRLWRKLDEPQKWPVAGIIADQIGIPLPDVDARTQPSRHSEPPRRERNENIARKRVRVER
jgi:transcriptional regulator with XRE-family HTH domain